MSEIFLEQNQAEDILRQWFESGIAYNLTLGTLDERKQRGLQAFGYALDSIPLLRRPYVYGLLDKAFNPRGHIEYAMAHLALETANLAGWAYCISMNYPHWPLELFTRATKPSVLAPQNILRAYYLVRSELDKHPQKGDSIKITDSTLIALHNLVNNRQLTSNLVEVEEGTDQGGLIPFVIHSYDLFTNTNQESFHTLGTTYQHFINIARDLSLEKDPLNRVKFSLLDGKKYPQWALTLHALCCQHNNSSSINHISSILNQIPRKYHSDIRNPKLIDHQLKKFPKREKALWQFLKPSPDEHFQYQEEPIDKIEPTIMKKMVLCHFIMLYLSMLSNSTWSLEMRKCIYKLKKLYPNEYINKLSNCLYFKEECLLDKYLQEKIYKLFQTD
ncbi:hypothetical protein Q9X95_004303, partial [Vibrio parahaemolyticus]|nr:hypothetical protein [Vibrio parahaemolyticus]